MPNQQAVTALATEIARIYNSSLPVPDTSLPIETQRQMAAAMADIRNKNNSMAAQLATAINVFVKKSTVKVNLPWNKLRVMLNGRFSPVVKLSSLDIVWCQNHPGLSKTLSEESEIVLSPPNDTVSIDIENTNAII